MESLYERYALIDAQMKDLEGKKETLRVNILKMMSEKELDKVETTFGSFTVARLKRWEYSEKVIELNEKYKALKAKEESCGIATFTESDSLRFTAQKL